MWCKKSEYIFYLSFHCPVQSIMIHRYSSITSIFFITCPHCLSFTLSLPLSLPPVFFNILQTIEISFAHWKNLHIYVQPKSLCPLLESSDQIRSDQFSLEMYVSLVFLTHLYDPVSYPPQVILFTSYIPASYPGSCNYISGGCHIYAHHSKS